MLSEFTAQKMKFLTKYFFSKCDQIRSFLRILSNLLKKSLIENSIFCAVRVPAGSCSLERMKLQIDCYQLFILTFANK